MAESSTLTDASFQDKVFVTITRKSDSTSIDFQGLLNEVGFSGFEQDFESQPVMNGGRIRQHSAKSDAEFTGTLYPVGANVGDGGSRPSGVHEFFYGSGDVSSSDDGYHKYETALNRDDFEVAVLWTNAETEDETVSTPVEITSATQKVVGAASGDNSGRAAIRQVMDNAQCTQADLNFDDRILTVEVTFKAPPFDETQSSTVFVEDLEEGEDGTLPAL